MVTSRFYTEKVKVEKTDGRKYLDVNTPTNNV